MQCESLQLVVTTVMLFAETNQEYTSLHTSRLAPPAISSWTTSVWPRPLAIIRGVNPSYMNKMAKKMAWDYSVGEYEHINLNSWCCIHVKTLSGMTVSQLQRQDELLYLEWLSANYRMLSDLSPWNCAVLFELMIT